jgi:hypothetical protein
MLNGLVEITKQRALEKVEEHESESKEMTKMVCRLTEGLEIIEAETTCLRTLFGTSCEPAATRLGIMRMFVCYKEILNDKKRFCFAKLKYFTSSSHLHTIVPRPLYCGTLQTTIQMTCLRSRESVSSLSACLVFISCLCTFQKTNRLGPPSLF